MATNPDRYYENLRAMYREANAYSMHLTKLNWDMGAILIAGSLVAVGAGLQSKQTYPAIFLAIGAIISIIVWFLFLKRNHDFGNISNEVMERIEAQLVPTGPAGYGLFTTFKTNRSRIHGPIGYHCAVFLAVGLISSLVILIIYLLFFPLH